LDTPRDRRVCFSRLTKSSFPPYSCWPGYKSRNSPRAGIPLGNPGSEMAGETFLYSGDVFTKATRPGGCESCSFYLGDEICPICQDSIAGRFLQKHLAVKHNVCYRFYCEICTDKSWKKKEYAIKHFCTAHGEARDFKKIWAILRYLNTPPESDCGKGPRRPAVSEPAPVGHATAGPSRSPGRGGARPKTRVSFARRTSTPFTPSPQRAVILSSQATQTDSEADEEMDETGESSIHSSFVEVNEVGIESTPVAREMDFTEADLTLFAQISCLTGLTIQELQCFTKVVATPKAVEHLKPLLLTLGFNTSLCPQADTLSGLSLEEAADPVGIQVTARSHKRLRIEFPVDELNMNAIRRHFTDQ